MVGGAEGPLIAGFGGVERDACRGLDAEDFEEFVEFGRGHDAGDALGDHGFSGAGAPDHDEVVPSANRDFDSAAEVVLSFYIGKISLGRVGICGVEGGEIGGEGINLDFAVQETHRLVEALDRDNIEVADESGFPGGGFGQKDAFFVKAAGELRHREAAFDGSGFSGKAEFTGDEVILQRCGLALFHGG